MTSILANRHLRDELELRRRHLLDALDVLLGDHLQGRVSEWRRNDLVDDIEGLVKRLDTELLRNVGQRS